MKAAQINSYGGPDIIKINNDAPVPSTDKNRIIVEVHAASINPFDSKVRAGYMKDMMPLTFPTTIGGDFSGVVSAVGDGVTNFKVGDQVYGSALVFAGGSGAFAEFALVNTNNASLKPHTTSFEEAAALPLVGSSAVQAIEEHINLQAGQKILIHGGAGGIGHVAIQVAKTHDAYVATTVSSEDTEFVKQLGADQIIDYKKEQFTSILKDFDAVFDTVGGDVMKQSLQILKKGGVLVSMLGKPNDAEVEKYGITAIAQGTKTNFSHLKRLAELVDNNHVKIHIAKTFSLELIQEAFVYQEEMHLRGKVVITIKS